MGHRRGTAVGGQQRRPAARISRRGSGADGERQEAAAGEDGRKHSTGTAVVAGEPTAPTFSPLAKMVPRAVRPPGYCRRPTRSPTCHLAACIEATRSRSWRTRHRIFPPFAGENAGRREHRQRRPIPICSPPSAPIGVRRLAAFRSNGSPAAVSRRSPPLRGARAEGIVRGVVLRVGLKSKSDRQMRDCGFDFLLSEGLNCKITATHRARTRLIPIYN